MNKRKQVPAHDPQICSRFHYWLPTLYVMARITASNVVDYILFLQVQDEVPVIPNPDEVSADYKYVPQRAQGHDGGTWSIVVAL
jgi:isopentenyldiphosphate isomerase